MAQVRKVLPRDLRRRYEQRQSEDALLRADLPGLVRCPHCGLAVDVPEEQRILKCAPAAPSSPPRAALRGASADAGETARQIPAEL